MAEQILYDLIVHEEWKQEPEILNEVETYFWQHRGSLLTKLWKLSQGSMSYMLKVLKTQFRYQTSFGCPPYHFINLINSSLHWTTTLTRDGRFVAILQDSNIEIRSSPDSFSTVIANCKVERDTLPQWQRIAWNEMSYIVAYANSFGDVQLFDLTGTRKCSILQSKSSGLNVPGTLSQAVSFLYFTKSDNENWSSMLYVATYQGYLKCYYINEEFSFKEKYTFNFAYYHPYGVSSLVYDEKNALIIAAGNYGKEPFVTENDGCYGSHCALSVWRLLSDFPHLTLVEDRGKAVKKLSGKDVLKRFMSIQRRQDEESLKHGIYTIRLSPDATKLVSLHINGRITLWNYPSMKLHKTWDKSEQPGFDSHAFDTTKIDEYHLSNVVDIQWWSEKEVILSVGSGAVTISSIKNLENLLGDSPERFDYWPTLSQAVDGHILVLECERAISQIGGKTETSEKKNWLSEADEEEGSFRSRLKEISKQTLYFLTEADRFLPTIKPTKTLTNTYRLVCLKSTTPEELYARKIELEHYGEALDLAKRFSLNADLVYQRQWRMKQVTKITIQDHLTKIKDRFWVLDECLLRIPNDFDATKELLKYGLLGTSWKVIQSIESLSSDKDIAFVLDENSIEEIDESDEAMMTTLRLSSKQQRLCRYRWQLLQYLDRLSTYEVILGGSFKAHEKFDAKFFAQFRSCNIVHQAVEYARDEDSISLEHLFSYHGHQVLPHWLPILSNFPETVNVRDYDPVIPEIGESPDDPEILPWLEKHHRDTDWVEQEHILSQIQHELDTDDDLGGFIYEAQPDLIEFKNCSSKEVLQKWFVQRIHEIDIESRQINKCCQMTKLGIKRALKGLQELNVQLETLRILTYDINIETSITLKEFLDLTDLSKMKILMSKSTDETFVGDFKKYITPFLQTINKKANKQKLLHHFLTGIAKTDLTCCLKLFEKSSPEFQEPLIPDVAELMKLAMDCIYVCKRDDQLNMAFSIVECLPSREEGIISGQIEELHGQLDHLELILSGAEILEYHGHPQTVSYVLETKGNSNIAKDIIQTLIKNTRTKLKPASASDWNTLLKHLLKLVKDVYTTVDIKHCHQMFAEGLLQSGNKQNICLAEELLITSRVGTSRKNKTSYLKAVLNPLKYDISVNVAVDAAKEYFNSAASLSDQSMDLAKCCLALITDNPTTVQHELDLIDSLYILHEFNLVMLPLQVRLCPDKLDLVDLCLKEKDKNYKKTDKLLKLGNLLRIRGDEIAEREGQIRMKITEVAFQHADYNASSTLCHELIKDGFQEAWKICRELGECDAYTNYTSRQQLLSFALTYCPVYCIEDILKKKTLLETQILYEKLSRHVNENIEDNNSNDDDDLIDGQGQSLLRKTTKQTKKILSNVTDNKWITGAMKWVQANSHQTDTSVQDKDGVINSLVYHPFYKSLGSTNISSKQGLTEFCDHLSRISNETVTFNQLLYKSQKLSERRAEGEVLEDTDEALMNLINIEYSKDSMLCLAYMMSLSSATAVQKALNEQRKSTFNFLFLSYYYALQLYSQNNNLANKHVADVYFTEPKMIMSFILKHYGNEDEFSQSKEGKLIMSNLTSLSDLLQAHLLQKLNKGVDIERFAIDGEYKKETILGLAMNLEDDLLNTCILLADKYDVALWEVMLSHVEFLYADSGLKAKAIRDQLSKWNVESTLKEHGEKVFERLKTFVYPEINGNDHNMLLLFYVFLLNCTSPAHKLQGQLTLDAHVKLLKKIKAAAPLLDYKLLVHGDSPLDVIATSVKENNVHLLAKIASKIPQTGDAYLSSSDVFLAYIMKSFWEPDKQSEQLDWMRHFETCQKLLSKVKTKDIIEFSHHIVFSDRSFDLLTHDIRIDITNRLLKYTRQQKGNDEVKLKGKDGSDLSLSVYNDVISHLETSLFHLKSLKHGDYLMLCNSTKDDQRQYAKRYDLSEGCVDKISKLCSDMFLGLESIEVIAKLLRLHDSKLKIEDCFHQALIRVLDDIRCKSDYSIFKGLVQNIKQYNQHGGENVTVNDFLEVVRPFCSDVNVDMELKSNILYILQDVFSLTSEDVELLLFYQTDAIISSKWSGKIKSEDINSDINRKALFLKLCDDTKTVDQIDGLEQLLLVWPSFTASLETNPENVPWIKIIMKRIELRCYSSILLTLKQAKKQLQLNHDDYIYVYENVKEHDVILSFKILLYGQHEKCYDVLFARMNKMKDEHFDDEFLMLLLSTKTFYRIADSHLFAPLIDYVITHNDGTILKDVINNLVENNLEVEAGSLHLRYRASHSSLYTISNAMNFVKIKLS